MTPNPKYNYFIKSNTKVISQTARQESNYTNFSQKNLTENSKILSKNNSN